MTNIKILSYTALSAHSNDIVMHNKSLEKVEKYIKVNQAMYREGLKVGVIIDG